MAKNKIYILDVTNRDGVQTAMLGLAKLEKTMINMYLNDMGIYQSEFGFPVTRHETSYLNANLELAEMGVLKPIILSGWIRAIKKDVEDATRLTRVKHLNLSISTSQQMVRGKFEGRKGREDILKMMSEACDKAKEKGIETFGVNAEDASRTDDEYLIRFAQSAKEHGACRIRYCDTLGYDDPFSIYEKVKLLAKEVKLPIELHCHNDLGMAVACSVAGAKAAIDSGVDAYINTTINAMGERCGNADLIS
ncbi:MAG: homocitrate synthase, partial [Elusimicrobiota bacterium]|nr:homocitrate synthase [Elusimicrobiota bacterium]